MKEPGSCYNRLIGDVKGTHFDGVKKWNCHRKQTIVYTGGWEVTGSSTTADRTCMPINFYKEL